MRHITLPPSPIIIANFISRDRCGGGFKKTEEARENDSTVRFNGPRIIQLFGANLLDEELERWRLHGFYLQLSIIEYAPESSQSSLSLFPSFSWTAVSVKSVVVPISPFFRLPVSFSPRPLFPCLSLPADTL